MSDFFDEFNKILKKDFVPIFNKYLKGSNTEIIDNLNEFINDPQILLTKIFDKFSNNKDNDNDPRSYTDVENITDNDPCFDDDYDDLFERLTLIEENMILIKKILKDQN